MIGSGVLNPYLYGQMVKVFGRVSAQQLPPGRGVLVTTDGAMEGVLVATPE